MTAAAVLVLRRILCNLLLVQLILQSICSRNIVTDVDALSLTQAVSIRPATSVDVKEAQKVLFLEKMNPLSVSETTMLVASCGSDDNEDGNVNDGDDDMIGFGQIRPLDEDYSELASLYVYPSYRHQGVGSKLVTALLSRHDEDGEQQPQPKTVCLLTLNPTVPFYERHGFRVVSSDDERRELPSSLQVEYFLGSIVSKVLNNELVCMVRNKS